jgi:hypothetical protein
MDLDGSRLHAAIYSYVLVTRFSRDDFGKYGAGVALQYRSYMTPFFVFRQIPGARTRQLITGVDDKKAMSERQLIDYVSDNQENISGSSVCYRRQHGASYSGTLSRVSRILLRASYAFPAWA